MPKAGSRIGESFPERSVEAIRLDGLPAATAELVLAEKLAAYGQLREKRITGLSTQDAAHARILFVGLQQRLLSSVAAFARTVKTHRKALAKLGTDPSPIPMACAAARAFVDISAEPDQATLGLEDEAGVDEVIADDDAVEAATALAQGSIADRQHGAELAAVDEMIAVTDASANKRDARVDWLVKWMRNSMIAPNGQWNDRRVIIFTEYEDTRRWLERRIREAIEGTDRADDRIGIFTGTTSMLLNDGHACAMARQL